MVTAVSSGPQSETIFGSTAIAVAEPVRRAPAAPACERCGTRLVAGYDEPGCPACGWSDYSKTSVKARSMSVFGSATRYILRYVGDFPKLAHTLVHVRLVRSGNRAVFAVACPFCRNRMEESSLSGRRPDLREQRYKCDDGHRISLVPVKGGLFGWR